MGLARMFFSKSKVNEYRIEVPTMLMQLTDKDLNELKVTEDLYSYILQYSKYIRDDISIKLQKDLVYLFITHVDRHLKCVIAYKDYLGDIGSLPEIELNLEIETVLKRLTLAGYIMLSSGKLGDPTGELECISKDIRCLKDKIDMQLSNKIIFSAGSNVIKYEYKNTDNKFVIERVEDYEVRSSRELKVRIGDVYLLDATDGMYVYCGTTGGTVFTLVKDIDKNTNSILYRELLKDGVGA